VSGTGEAVDGGILYDLGLDFASVPFRGEKDLIVAWSSCVVRDVFKRCFCVYSITSNVHASSSVAYMFRIEQK